MPYFLQGEIRHPVEIESEYGRVLAEQGVIGLVLWVGFVLWCIIRRTPFLKSAWLPARRLIWYGYTLSFVTSTLGLGMLTAIPGTFLLLLGVGWTVVPPAAEAPTRLNSALRPQSVVRRNLGSVYAG